MKKENNVKKDFKPIWIYLLCTIVLTIVIAGIVGVVEAIKGGELNTDKMTFLSSVIPSIILFIIFAIIYRKRVISDLKKLKIKDILFIVLISAVTIAINYVISMIFEKLGVKMNNQDSLVSMFASHKILISLLTCIIAPFTEELVFRYSFSTFIKNKYVFLIVSSLIFGLFHAIGVATILYVFLGAMFGLVYLKYKNNVVASMLIHFINNTFSIITMFILL
jgi:membrane protease YdiL (CAAX protease family)